MMSEFEGDSGQPAGEPGNTDGALPALPVIQRFGGIRPTAQKLGVPVSTVQGWKERGAIPANRREEVLAAAARHNIAFEPGDLAETAPPAIELPATSLGDDTAELGGAVEQAAAVAEGDMHSAAPEPIEEPIRMEEARGDAAAASIQVATSTP